MAIGDARTMEEHSIVSGRILEEAAGNSMCAFGKRKTPSELRLEQLKRSKSQDSGPLQKSTVEPPRPELEFSLSRLKSSLLEDDTSRDSVTSKKTDVPALFRLDSINRQVSVSTFKNVTELSSRSYTQTSRGVDVSKAIKGLTVKKDKLISRTASAPSIISTEGLIQEPFVEFSRSPLDLSLKTCARFTSSKPFYWCLRASMRDRFDGLQQFLNGGSNLSEDGGRRFWTGLRSWIHPHVSFSSELLASLAAKEDKKEASLVLRLQREWEASFNSLYYAFRDKACNMFYFCTQQFVVLFIGGRVGGREANSCSSYLSRSTKRLRGILHQQGVEFSMPLCKRAYRSATTEELRELTEYEKLNPGQTRFVDCLSGIDNSMESLLALDGTENVHRLYDLLLNYRSIFGAKFGLPTLCSPVAFENASLSVPEVSTKQMQNTADDDVTLLSSYSLEIKGEWLPPWVISRLCASIHGLYKEEGFEVNFTTEVSTEGLNVAQRDEISDGFSEFGQASQLGGAVIRHLKCPQGSSSYIARL